MKLPMIMSFVAFVSGCSGPPPLTNEQIIAEARKCETAGLEARTIRTGISSRISRVECVPKTESMRFGVTMDFLDIGGAQ